MELMKLKLNTSEFVREMEVVLSLPNTHRAKHFLCTVFCNYYSQSYRQSVDLTQMDFIDTEFKQLFINLVLLRHRGFQGDGELCQLSARCKAFLDS